MHLATSALRLTLLACALLAALALTAGCHSLHGAYMPLGPALPPRPPDAPVQVYLDGRLPEGEWHPVARLDVRLERTGFVPAPRAEALYELRRQARLAGADAVIDVRERRSWHLETRSYRVSAVAVTVVAEEAEIIRGRSRLAPLPQKTLPQQTLPQQSLPQPWLPQRWLPQQGRLQRREIQGLSRS